MRYYELHGLKWFSRSSTSQFVAYKLSQKNTRRYAPAMPSWVKAGIAFSGVSLYVCLFLCLSAQKNWKTTDQKLTK